MKKLSFRQQSIYWIVAINASFLSLGLFITATNTWSSNDLIWLGVALLWALLSSYTSIRSIDTALAPIQALNQVSQSVIAGNLHQRIRASTHPQELGEMCWQVNDMLDQLEICFQEQKNTVVSSNQGMLFRQPLIEGLNGTLKESLNQISQLIHRQTR